MVRRYELRFPADEATHIASFMSDHKGSPLNVSGVEVGVIDEVSLRDVGLGELAVCVTVEAWECN